MNKRDMLLDPARVLVGAYGENKVLTDAFAERIARPDGGQKVVGEVAVDSIMLYTRTLWESVGYMQAWIAQPAP